MGMDIIAEIQKLKKAIPRRTYNEWTVLLSQTGATIPTATILYNNLGTFTLSRTSAGVYRITSAVSVFTSAKTFILNTFDDSATVGPGLTQVSIEVLSPTVIEISSYANGSLSDNVITKASLSIRVYK